MCKRTRSVRVAQRERVFSFDGSTAVFFLPPQKENGGGKPAGVARHPLPRPLGGDNPSVTAAPCQLPLHKGAFGDGGCGLPRRPVGPPRNDNGFLSFRGAERRGNPYFYDGRGFGPPYLGHGLRRPNSVPKFGASVRSSAPTEGQRCNSGLPASEQGCSPCIPGPGRRPPHCGSRDRSSLFAKGFDPLPDS